MKSFSVIVLALVLVAPTYAKGGGGHSSSGHSSGGYSSSSAGSNGSGRSHSTSAYTKSNGTYVAPSHATNPNTTKSDNWTTKGNTNPYTGKAGTKSND